MSKDARVMLKNVSTTILKKDIYQANLIDRKVESAVEAAGRGEGLRSSPSTAWRPWPPRTSG